ncbi:MAG: ankyrin repeat domain-containing protein [Coxiellaceae bacterium]|nr:ankyrin repeat domain-containing protein [Coxiellaceae bacterium]
MRAEPDIHSEYKRPADTGSLLDWPPALPLTPFLPLLKQLHRKHYSQPMDSTKAPEETTLDQAKTDQRYSWTQQYSPEIKHDDAIVYRSNHGAVHHYRSMKYVSHVAAYYRQFGSEEIVEFFHHFDEEGAQKLMLCMAYSSIARDSEVDFFQQPEAHQYYRRRAGELFTADYQQYHTLKASAADIPAHLACFGLFESEDEFKHYRAQLIALGSETNHDPIHIALNTCHKLDLLRCRTRENVETSVLRYIRQNSNAALPYGLGISRLLNYGYKLMLHTGDQIKSAGQKREDERFIACDNPEHGISTIDSMPFDINAKPTKRSDTFFIKSIRADGGDYWNDFLYNTLKSCVNNRKSKTLRIARPSLSKMSITNTRRDYTVKLSRHGSAPYDVTHKNLHLNAMYSPDEKRGFTKPQSLSFVDPDHYFEAPAFGWNRNRQTLLVGVKMRPEHVKVNRIISYDSGTFTRPHDHLSAREAATYLEKKTGDHIYFNSTDDLVKNGSAQRINEILGRINAIDAILVFSDNLESRLLAQHRCQQLNIRLREVENENNLTPGCLGTREIEFYLPKHGSEKHLTVYDEAAQTADRTNPEAAAIIAAYTTDTTSYIERHRITPTHLAAARGDLTALASATTADNINQQDTLGRTALHFALENGHIALVEWLLQQPTLEIVADTNGDTFVLAALKNRGIDYVTQLFSIPLFIDKFSHHQAPLVLDHLLDHDHSELLFQLLKKCESTLASKDYLKLHNDLLFKAIKANQESTALRLMSHDGIKLDRRDESKSSPLSYAALHGNVTLMQAIVTFAPSINLNKGKTTYCKPLTQATRSGNIEAVRFLLAHGAKPTTSSRNLHYTAMHVAAENNYTDIMVELLAHGAMPRVSSSRLSHPLHFAVKNGHIEAVNLLLSIAKLPINKTNTDNRSPLMLAAEHSHTAIAELLLNAGAKVNQLLEDYSALHYAVLSKNFPLVKLLIEHGAKADKRTNDLATPLHFAVQTNRLDIVQLLLNHGADATKANTEGKTVVDLASAPGKETILAAINRKLEEVTPPPGRGRCTIC